MLQRTETTKVKVLSATFPLVTDLFCSRAQYMLCISYAYVHLYLYRPSLQYTLRNPEQSPFACEDSSCYAIACVQASQNIVLLCEDMYKRGLLRGGNWPAIRMLCSAIVTLFYIIIASRGSYQPDSLFKSLAIGMKLLDQLAKQSYPASRFKVILVVSQAPTSVPCISTPFLTLIEDHGLDPPGRSTKGSRQVAEL